MSRTVRRRISLVRQTSREPIIAEVVEGVATMELAVPTIITGSESSSRKSSLRESIASASSPVRKDSVILLVPKRGESESSTSSKSSLTSNPDVIVGTDRVRRLSRKLSLKPPPNVYREKRESSPRYSIPFSTQATKSSEASHSVICECGREFTVPCTSTVDNNINVPAIRLSTAEVTDLKRAFANSQKSTDPSESISGPLRTPEHQTKPLTVHQLVESMQNTPNDYDAVLKSCIDIGSIEDQDSLDAVLSRQAAIKCLVDAIKAFPDKQELQLEACKSLLKQIEHSEASLHYLTLNDGIERLHHVMKKHAENTDLLAYILDIFGYISSNDEWRNILSEKINQSDFLTTMARHESDVVIVQKCCVVVSNLVISEDLARSMMYVGGVHSIISMMNKYNTNIEVLKHCCNALGTFASHDDTCQAVAEAGATNAVMTLMTSFPDNAAIQESCCWALASLSRSDCACMELVYTDAFNGLMKCMATFPQHPPIQEYGCWALCNLAVLGSKLDDKDGQSAIEILIQNMATFTHNVELLEHICYAINTFVSLKPYVHEFVVTRDGVSRLVELIRTFEDNVDIHINGIKVIGNLAVNVDFRRYLEDMGASEAIISCMLKQDKHLDIQNISCITLTNLSADVMDNKYRILKNGAVHAVLQAMTNFMEDGTLQLNALKLLCNLLESDKGCWWIAEECGIQVISMTLKNFAKSEGILTFGCTCLASLPRRGMNVVALESVESTLLYLRQSMSTSTDVALSICTFYENVLKAGKDCKKLFNEAALQKVLHILQDFDDIDIQMAGCKILAQVTLADDLDLLSRELTSVLITSMRDHLNNENIQIVCCGTISYLSCSESRLDLLQDLGCLEIILECMRVHQQNAQIQTVCLGVLKNLFRADLIRGKMIQNVCDAISKSLKANPEDNEIQLEGCHILSCIGTSFHKQNEKRRQSADFLEQPVNTIPRKSVTEEILEVASAAIQRIKKFKDEVLTDNDDLSETELESIKFITELRKATSTPESTVLDNSETESGSESLS